MKYIVLSELEDMSNAVGSSARNNLYGEDDVFDNEDDNLDIELGDNNESNDSEDIDRAGLIRTVSGAHLVYKRQQQDDTYEELWIYNIDPKNHGFEKSHEIRQNILAGTDIPINALESEDGAQKAEIWAIGNAELLKLAGLIN